MTNSDVASLMQQHFAGVPGFDAATLDHATATIALATTAVNGAAGLSASGRQPTSEQQQCYAGCAKTRDEALQNASRAGFPLGIPMAAAAILAFNACRHQCDAINVVKDEATAAAGSA